MLLCFLLSGKAAAREVELWSYHDYPPFVIDADQEFGFSHGFTQLLNRYAGERYHFVLRTAPRRRVDHWLGEGREGVVLWVNPSWFDDLAQSRYHWSDALLMDVNEVISLKATPLRYRGPDSVRKLRFGAVLGEMYPSIDDLVAEGALQRDDVADPELNLRKLLRGRIDFTIMPRSELVYMTHDSKHTDRLYVSPVPFQRFTRHLLIQTEDAKLVELFRFFEEHVDVDREWRALRSRYYMR